MKTPLELCSEVIRTRDRYHRGEASMKELYEVVDLYIAAVTAHAKEMGKEEGVPAVLAILLLRAL
jgi:hypothetical protein